MSASHQPRECERRHPLRRSATTARVWAGPSAGRVPCGTSWVALALVFTLAGCAFFRIAHVPVPYETFAPHGPEHARGAIVLLPGFGDDPATFVEQGFIETLRAHAPGYDLFVADAHFGYYRGGTIAERVGADLLADLRARGYRELWIGGASMGGHGAVGVAREHPERVRGVLLFAPYMGPSDVIDEVRAAGGLCDYYGPIEAHDRDDFARANFSWLSSHVCHDTDVSVWLAVGEDDRLRVAGSILMDEMPSSHVIVLPGGHGWDVWTPAAAQLAERAFGSPVGQSQP